MALVAAGSEDADAFFSGAAPESELVVVRLKPARTYLRDFFLIREDAIAFQEDDIMLGIKFLLYIARQEKKPLVILLGLGTNTGSHSGTSPLGLYLNSLSRASGQILVAAGGNETGRGHHFRSVFPASTSYEDVELRVGPGERGFTLELWARESELYSVGFIPLRRRNGTHPALRRRRTPDSLSSGRNDHSPQLYQLRAGDRKRTDPDAL